MLSAVKETHSQQQHQAGELAAASNAHQQATHKLRTNKAFTSILTTASTKFDGENLLRYKPWRDALVREMEGLQLTDAQWLDLLRARTSGGALDALEPSGIIQQEYSAAEALTIAWTTLEEKYGTPQRPSQQLIENLLPSQSLPQTTPMLSTLSPRDAKQWHS